MAAARVSPPAACPAALVSRVRASSPVALRAGSAAPSLRESSCRAAPVSSSQPYVFFGQPSDFAAAGTIAIPTGLEATLPTRATSVASPSAEICSTHTSESGTHTCTPGSLPAASVSLTLYDSRAVTVMSTQRPSEVRFSSRARSAALRRAGATSGRRRAQAVPPRPGRRSRRRADRPGRRRPSRRRRSGRGPSRWPRYGGARVDGGRCRPPHTDRASCDVPWRWCPPCRSPCRHGRVWQERGRHAPVRRPSPRRPCARSS